MKTVSLELSKQLKEAGYPQDTAYFWCDGETDTKGRVTYLTISTDHKRGLDMSRNTPDFQWEGMDTEFASPTADEILDLLPDSRGTLFDLLFYKTAGKYQCQVEKHTEGGTSVLWHFNEESLADAAARMWLYLKKRGL